MELEINKISEEHYKSLESKELIEVEKTFKYNHFVEIIAYQQSFKLCWQSYFSFPDVYKIDSHNYFIGIDLNFLIFDFLNSKTKLSMKLDSYYIEYLKLKNIFIVVTELDIYIINIQSVVVESINRLPDVFSNIKIDKDIARACCIDGSEINIRLTPPAESARQVTL